MNFVDLILKRIGVALKPVLLLTVMLVLLSCGIEVDRGSSINDVETNNEVNAGDDNLGFTETVFQGESLEAPSDVAKELTIIWEAWAILTKDHVDRAELDPRAMSEAAIRGMLIALGDPHTNYVPPEAFAIDSNDIFQGEFEGIGAHVSMNRSGVLIIVAPIQGSPAEKAGIRPGDQILGVDGMSLDGYTVLQAVSLIRGPKGSTVKLLVKHLGAIDAIEIEVIRGTIPLVSVLVRSLPEDSVAHLRITNFHDNTANELTLALDKAIKNGASGLIIDVRDNPGGTLQSVIDITSKFLNKDLLIAYQIDASQRRTDWKVKDGGKYVDIPLVVLSNSFSASASEVLIGAFQDNNRATIIGDVSFGKGSVNMLRPLSNGGGMFVTTSRWFTPKGKMIQGVGIEPDIHITATDPTDADVLQLEAALKEIQQLIEERVSINTITKI
ncbi:MAG: carboxyl-terminal processing protease [Chloroflexi bacterium]|jgi:carboxyl-terminal processing protease|nr:MAG: carboxyl-terminal processing protease [Chloroflexota bacterium]